jgi:hypothetical protein
MSLVNPGIELRNPIGDELKAMEQRASPYWKGASIDAMKIPETLVTGTVRIEKECRS